MYRTIIILFICITSAIFFKTAIAKTDDFDTDKFLRTIDLPKLINKNKVLNLIAQLSTPFTSTSNVNDMDDFFAIANIDENYDSIITEFDRSQDILQQITLPSAWVGVSPYNQLRIPLETLQQGFQDVQTCMSKQGTPISNTISRLVIYKTIDTEKMIYDYAFTDPNLPFGICQEVLYIPSTHGCTYGMVVFCHVNLLTLKQKNKPIKNQ